MIRKRVGVHVNDTVDITVACIPKKSANFLKLCIERCVKQKSYLYLSENNIISDIRNYFKDYYLSKDQTLLYNYKTVFYQIYIIEGEGYLSESSSINIYTPDLRTVLIPDDETDITQHNTNISLISLNIKINKYCDQLMKYINNHSKLNLIMVHGTSRSGKTSIVTTVMQNMNALYCKYVGAADAAKMKQYELLTYVTDVFKTARSVHQSSLLLLDDVEILLNYSDLGTITFCKKMYRLLTANFKTVPTSSYSMSIVVVCQNEALCNYINHYFTHTMLITDTP